MSGEAAVKHLFVEEAVECASIRQVSEEVLRLVVGPKSIVEAWLVRFLIGTEVSSQTFVRGRE